MEMEAHSGREIANRMTLQVETTLRLVSDTEPQKLLPRARCTGCKAVLLSL